MGAPRRPRAPRVRINVTEGIIDVSEQRNSSHCMVAEAVKMAVPGAKGVSVDIQTIRWTDPAKPLRYIYLTPRKVQAAIIRFDQGSHSEPFEFEVTQGQVIKANPRRATKPAPTPMPDGKSTELGSTENGPSGLPRVVGGQGPPRASLSNTGGIGNRRTFGLRAFDRLT
jgi:hypothetical protein